MIWLIALIAWFSSRECVWTSTPSPSSVLLNCNYVCIFFFAENLPVGRRCFSCVHNKSDNYTTFSPKYNRQHIRSILWPFLTCNNKQILAMKYFLWHTLLASDPQHKWNSQLLDIYYCSTNCVHFTRWFLIGLWNLPLMFFSSIVCRYITLKWKVKALGNTLTTTTHFDF